MPTTTPLRDLALIQRRAVHDSRSWFPPGVHRTTSDATVHYAFGLAAYARQVVKLIQAAERGEEVMAVDLAYEMADVLSYLCKLADSTGIDLAAAVEAKRAVLVERWGET